VVLHSSSLCWPMGQHSWKWTYPMSSVTAQNGIQYALAYDQRVLAVNPWGNICYFRKFIRRAEELFVGLPILSDTLYWIVKGSSILWHFVTNLQEDCLKHWYAKGQGNPLAILLKNFKSKILTRNPTASFKNYQRFISFSLLRMHATYRSSPSHGAVF
jgi:hypothetical protein